MIEKRKDIFLIQYAVIAVLVIVVVFSFPLKASAGNRHATTTVTISICGDGILNGGEVCDDGAINNDGGYGSSIAARHCLPDCQGYGPYCGDTIIHFLYSEECDDGNNSDGDLCSAVCLNEEDPINTTGGGATGGGESGAGGEITGVVPMNNPTRVSISGKAYAGSRVHILKDGEEISTVSANSLANFSKQLDNLTAGPATFGFWADDGSGLRSITFTTTFQVTQSAVTTVSGIYIPPTIKSSDTAVRHGEEITFSGITVPNAKVDLYIDGGNDFIEEAESEGDGHWEISFDTTPLENETFHTAKASFIVDSSDNDEGDIESGFGQTINFYVGEGEGQDTFFADLNVDGRVDIIDFSILLFHWGGTGGGAVPSPDINHDGTVNLTDFSIMIFYWTG